MLKKPNAAFLPDISVHILHLVLSAPAAGGTNLGSQDCHFNITVSFVQVLLWKLVWNSTTPPDLPDIALVYTSSNFQAYSLNHVCVYVCNRIVSTHHTRDLRKRLVFFCSYSTLSCTMFCWFTDDLFINPVCLHGIISNLGAGSFYANLSLCSRPAPEMGWEIQIYCKVATSHP